MPRLTDRFIQGIRPSTGNQYSIYEGLVNPEYGFPGGALQAFHGETWGKYFGRIGESIGKRAGIKILPIPDKGAAQLVGIAHNTLLPSMGTDLGLFVASSDSLLLRVPGQMRPRNSKALSAMLREKSRLAKLTLSGNLSEAEFSKLFSRYQKVSSGIQGYAKGTYDEFLFTNKFLKEEIDMSRPMHRNLMATFRHELGHVASERGELQGFFMKMGPGMEPTKEAMRISKTHDIPMKVAIEEVFVETSAQHTMNIMYGPSTSPLVKPGYGISSEMSEKLGSHSGPLYFGFRPSDAPAGKVVFKTEPTLGLTTQLHNEAKGLTPIKAPPMKLRSRSNRYV